MVYLVLQFGINHSNYPKEWFILSQIRGQVVVLRDQIHRELGDLGILIWFVKQWCFKSFKSKLQFYIEQVFVQ